MTITHDVVYAMAGVLIFGQSLGLFLRSIEDNFSISKSVRIVFQVWALYGVYVIMPFVLLFQIWIAPKMWTYANELNIWGKMRLSIVVIFLTHIMILRKCAKRATAVYDLYKPHSITERPTLITIAERPIRNELLAMAMA